MVWHETDHAAVIVMLTPTRELGREKCSQYFPLDDTDSSLPLYFQTSSTDESTNMSGQIVFKELVDGYPSTIEVRRLTMTVGEHSKTVWHLLYTAFPDFGVPQSKDRQDLLNLIAISSEKNSNKSKPRIVHCSAGVGRSGTFIALDYLLTELAQGNHFDNLSEDADPIFDLVQNLREQRVMMVQSEAQYQFLYEVLAEQLALTV